jgi:glycosyltransferase involved in cell wall biosynthesis
VPTPLHAINPSIPVLTSVALSVSVVIPAKNEARNIGWVLERMPSYVDEVIVVDGLSTDGTLEIAKMIVPDVVVIHEDRPGKGAAMRAGMAVAGGDCVVVMDADGSMDPEEIHLYVSALAAGADLAKGSRFVEGGGSTDITRLRQFGNAQLLALANALFRTDFTELCYGFMALRRSAIARLALDADGFEIETQIVTRAVRAGLRICEVPSQEAPRRYGESNLHTFRDGWRVLRTMLAEWRGSMPQSTTAIPLPIAGDEVRAVEELVVPKQLIHTRSDMRSSQ